jgi:hypothetical protein
MFSPADTQLRGKYLKALERQMSTLIQEHEARQNRHHPKSRVDALINQPVLRIVQKGVAFETKETE